MVIKFDTIKIGNKDHLKNLALIKIYYFIQYSWNGSCIRFYIGLKWEIKDEDVHLYLGDVSEKTNSLNMHSLKLNNIVFYCCRKN